MNKHTIDEVESRPVDRQAPADAQAREPGPVRELLQRYRAIFGAAWSVRHELVGPARMADEQAFLPAALSLQETPVHPAPRRLAFAVMALFVIALLWSCFGKVDIVAVAPGTIIVGDRTKLIQPLEAGVVRRILVRDGMRVKAGEVLVELDATMASADKGSVDEQLRATKSERVRAALMLDSIAAGKAPPARSLALAMLDADGLAQWQAEWQGYQAQLARMGAEIAKRKTEIVTAQQSIAKLESVLPLVARREADFSAMLDGGYVAGHAAQDKTRERVEMERDLAMARARLAESQAALDESGRAMAAFTAETRRAISERAGTAETRLQQLGQEVAKAGQREKLTKLVAPVDGVVQQLAVHTPGGVVTAAQPLMIIVPDDAQMKAEINVANLDIGFVQAGQHAEIKLETFPFTRYGTVGARVERITADAVADEKKGSYYPAVLTLERDSMVVDGRSVKISPGMAINAEIKTGYRSVMDYLLSPIQRAGHEGLRER